MSDKQTWIDVTDLFEWDGYFTGIQRVTYNYAGRFAKDGARFFVHSKIKDKFVEVSFSTIEESQKRLHTNKKPSLTTKQKLKARYKRLPRFVRMFSSPLLNFAHRRLKGVLALGVFDNLSKLPPVTFSDQDTVILLDAAWNRKSFVGRLSQSKKESGFRLVVHLNDILPVYQTQLFTEELCERFSEYTHKTIRIADLVTVISEATKRDVERFCIEHKLKLPPIAVIRLGEDIAVAKPEEPKIKLSGNFIFCLGTFEIRKNYMLLYQAVKLAQQEGRELPQIVIAGRRGWLTHDLAYVLEHDKAIASKMILLDNMSDANIAWLFEHCIFTVFCSIAEGWGLPIAESLQHGKFCLSSNTSSMPEIAGNLIDYFSPYDTRACFESIDQCVKSKTYLKKAKHIKKVYKPLSWDDSYQQYKRLTHAS